MSTTVFDSFADAVDETYDPSLDGYDGDPTIRRSLAGLLPRPPRFLLAAKPAQSIVVPFIATGPGDEGDQVYALKRANAKFRGGGRLRKLMAKETSEEQRRRWGPFFTLDWEETQEKLGVKVTGEYDYASHLKLARYYDAFALALVRKAKAVSKRDEQIAEQLAWLNALYNRRANVAYSQARPSQLGSADRITRGDCSGSIAGSCHWANILPEVDWRYTNTWVQNSLGWGVDSVGNALVGDIFLYGSPSHEGIYVGDGIIWSFGSFPIKFLRYGYRSDLSEIRRFVP